MSLTVITVNANTWKYLYFLDQTLRRLANDSSFRWLIRNVTAGNAEADRLAKLPASRVISTDIGSLKGSEAHGAALNGLIEQVETEYGLLIDPDTALLARGWDAICTNELDGRYVAIGSPYSPDIDFRYQGYPNAIFMFFRAAALREMHIDFRPAPYWWRRLKHLWMSRMMRGRHWDDQDVGWRLPLLLRRHGYQAKCFSYITCDHPHSRVLAPDTRGVEFQWRGQPVVTHQGRSFSRRFNESPFSREWVGKVCSYVGLDRAEVATLTETEP